MSSRGQLNSLQAGVYRHYKGHHYLVLGYAENASNGAEQQEPYVVYVGLQLDGQPSPMRMRFRTAREFFGSVEVGPDTWVPRFRYMGPTVTP